MEGRSEIISAKKLANFANLGPSFELKIYKNKSTARFKLSDLVKVD